MPQIMPIKELRNTNIISERAHAKNEPIFITKNGYGDLVLMSMETYENIINEAAIDMAIAESESQIASGKQLLDAKEVFNNLRRKHFGNIQN